MQLYVDVEKYLYDITAMKLIIQECRNIQWHNVKNTVPAREIKQVKPICCVIFEIL